MHETGFDPWVGKILCRRKWQPTPVFLSRKSHGLRSLAGYSPWGCKELDTFTHFSLQGLSGKPPFWGGFTQLLFCDWYPGVCSDRSLWSHNPRTLRARRTPIGFKFISGFVLTCVPRVAKLKIYLSSVLGGHIDLGKIFPTVFCLLPAEAAVL